MEIYENLSNINPRIPASEQLTNIATAQEVVLEGLNKFKPISNEYSATNKDVVDNLSIDDSYESGLESMNYYTDKNKYKTPQ